MPRCDYLELQQHAWRVVSSHIRTHCKDTRFIKGRPQLASATCDKCQMSSAWADTRLQGIEACLGGGGVGRECIWMLMDLASSI